MLRIHNTILEMIADVRRYADAIAAKGRDLARQLRRASMSVLLEGVYEREAERTKSVELREYVPLGRPKAGNSAEGSGARGGTRRARYDDALGSARETRAGLEGAEAAGYIEAFRADSRRRFDIIIRTFVRIQHPR